MSIAPFEVVLCPLGYDRSETVRNTADILYETLKASGIDVILDDRGERPGVMFSDWELIGIPHRIVIGDNALIAPNVQIYTAFHPTNAADRFGPRKKDGTFSFCKTQTAPVIIGSNVWIGGGAILLPGVHIGDNVVIGAGSVVTRDIPDNTVACGNPCRVVRRNV